MIFFDKVSKKYTTGAPALEDINFAVERGEFVSIVGQSGAGKSTLLKLLIAEEMPTAGNVFFDSINVHNLPKDELYKLRRRIGVVFQDFRLLPTKTAYENIAFAMQAAGYDDETINNDVPQVLEVVGLINKSSSFPGELSGGERQRVAIARAIVNRPDIIIADEPTGNLDPLNVQEIVNLMAKINQLGTTVILTTHNKDVINALGRRVITIEKGRVVRDDKEGRYVL
jgi:cell division transport system ATP-binding protein